MKGPGVAEAGAPSAGATPWPDIEGFVLDLDGTVYRGDAPIDGAFEALTGMRTACIPIVFMTNNSTKSRVEFADKLTRMGFATEPQQVVNTAYATGRYLAAHFPAGTSVYVVGAPALRQEVHDAGFIVSDDGGDVVVVGLDRDFSYPKLRTAVQSILAGAAFIATNPDLLLPEGDHLVPGAGTLVAAVESATRGVTAPVLIGKPERHMPTIALNLLGTRPERTVAVGDQLFTDVAAAKAAGMFGVLVETGVPSRGEPGGVVADRVITSLLEIPVGAAEGARGAVRATSDLR